MNSRLKTILQFLLGISLAGGLLYYVYRDTSWEELSRDLGQADPFWVCMGGLALMGVFISRSLRWQMMLESSGFPAKTGTTLLSVLILYLVNSLTPKVGEVVRCSVLYKTDDVPVSSGLGTVITERIIDAFVLFSGLGIIFLMELERLGDLFTQIFSSLSQMFSASSLIYLALGGVLALAAAIAAYFYIRSRNNTGESKENGLLGRALQFFEQMLKATQSVFQLKRPALFFLYTACIWVGLILMNYFFILSLPDTAELGIYFALLMLFIGGLGWALPVPGGMGTTHFIVVQLFLAFGLTENAGKNIAALSNGATFIFSVAYGLIALAILGYLLYYKPKTKESL